MIVYSQDSVLSLLFTIANRRATKPNYNSLTSSQGFYYLQNFHFDTGLESGSCVDFRNYLQQYNQTVRAVFRHKNCKIV
jgi:hypothetical protein